METFQNSKFILTSTEKMDLKKTFECGQCFRWDTDKNGVYIGSANEKALRIWEEDDKIICSANDEDVPFWRNYFDLDVDYQIKALSFTEPPYLKACTDFGTGIRILRQEPWEALCSFIVSQCNNIPRIKKIISTLCNCFGSELNYGLYSFPSANQIAVLSEKDLAPLRCGYRTAYILNAARAVSNGLIDFETLYDMPSEEALAEIKKIHGVGDKVANCFMLYGLHRMDRFPIDVWMKRALKEHFPSDFNPATLGSYAGLAQQYIFYYTRTTGYTS